MYTYWLDDQILYYPGDSLCTLVGDPVIKLSIGQAGSCEMKIPETNPLYNSISLRKSMVTVKKGDKEIFCGEIRTAERDRDNNMNAYAVGELAFLADGIQPQHSYGKVTPTAFLAAVLSEHNDSVEERKQFAPGYVTVPSGWDDSVKQTDYDNSLAALRTQLVDRLGGCLRIRKAGVTRYVDYVTLSDYGAANTQGINFGENLLDYSENMTAADIVTCIIPLGARIDSDSDFEKRVDITSVNAGNNYLTASQTVLNRFGRIWRVVVFDDLDDPADIMAAGQAWLAENQYETMRLKITAVDLSILDSEIDDMYLGDRIPCRAEPYGLNMTLPIIEQTIHPLSPHKDTIVLSATLQNKKLTISDQVGSSGDSIRQATAQTELKIRNVIRQEVASLMARFAGTNGGYKLSEFDSNGLWLRDLWMDTPDKTTATNILEISMNGIRSSNAGYKPATDPAWKLGITIDGQINADRILTGTLMAGLIKAGILSDVAGNTSLNMETGALRTKNLELISPYLNIKPDGTIESTDGTEILTILEALLKGYYWKNSAKYLAGLLDLSADYGDGTHKVVLESKNGMIMKIASSGAFTIEQAGKELVTHDGKDMVFYIGSAGSFEFRQHSGQSYRSCGMIDGNGWHGQYSTT